MKHVPESVQQPDRPRNLDELRLRLARRRSDRLEGWKRCDNKLCRRRKQCCGDTPERTCADDGSPPRTVSPEETAKVMSDLYKEVKRRCAEFAAGAQPPDEESLRKLREAARAQRRKRKPAQVEPVTSASPPDVASELPAPVADQPQLAPDKQARIDRAWNDCVAEQNRAREPGPRITQL